MLDPGLSSSSKQSMFLNLLYKSLKVDIVLRRVKAFVKRLLQVSAEQSASFACGALFLVSEVMKVKPGLKTLLQEDVVRRWTEERRFIFIGKNVFYFENICFFSLLIQERRRGGVQRSA